MAADSGNGNDACISLKTGVHGPEHIADVKGGHVLIHQEDMLQLTECREGQQGGLTLPPLVGGNGFLNWRTAMNFPPPAEAQYTFSSRPGMARSTMSRMLASVGIPAMLTCSSLGPMQVCMMGFSGGSQP